MAAPMVTIPSPLSALIKTSVLINGLLIPGRQASTSLQRFCRPVCFVNPESHYEVSTVGSCFLFRYRSRCLAFLTRHQLVNAHDARAASEFCIIVDDEEAEGKLAVTPNEAASINYGNIEYRFAEDVQFVLYEESRNGRNLSRYFVDIDFEELPDLRAVKKDHLVAIMSIGYPSAWTSYDFVLDDDAVPHDMEVTHRFGKLIFANDWVEGMEFHLTLRQHENYPHTIGDLDGFSGSPVFFFYKDANFQVHLGFAGMIRLGGNGFVHIYEAAHMKKILDQGFPRADAG
jgi:hypothetical protein